MLLHLLCQGSRKPCAQADCSLREDTCICHPAPVLLSLSAALTVGDTATSALTLARWAGPPGHMLHRVTVTRAQASAWRRHHQEETVSPNSSVWASQGDLRAVLQEPGLRTAGAVRAAAPLPSRLCMSTHLSPLLPMVRPGLSTGERGLLSRHSCPALMGASRGQEWRHLSADAAGACSRARATAWHACPQLRYPSAPGSTGKPLADADPASSTPSSSVPTPQDSCQLPTLPPTY